VFILENGAVANSTIGSIFLPSANVLKDATFSIYVAEIVF
jgi:hypothetical protein